MFDVQQELHRLREKAVLIANDTTREEKLKKLQEDEQKWRADAMRLDQETAKCKRTLHALSKKIGLAGTQSKCFKSYTPC
jgi:septation ring formation regulator EzrA